MHVDRCVCRNVTFARLRGLAELYGPSIEPLAALTGCGTGCGLCRPYILRMLRTGEVRFKLITQEPAPPPGPGEARA